MTISEKKIIEERVMCLKSRASGYVRSEEEQSWLDSVIQKLIKRELDIFASKNN